MTHVEPRRYALATTGLLVAVAGLAAADAAAGAPAATTGVPLARGHAAKRLLVSLAFVGALVARRRGRE